MTHMYGKYTNLKLVDGRTVCPLTNVYCTYFSKPNPVVTHNDDDSLLHSYGHGAFVAVKSVFG
jgi:hypothetical protein